MNLWKKIKKGFHKSTEKAADFVEAGSELVQEGIDKIKSTQVDALELGKFQTEVEGLKQTVHKGFSDLGSHVYDLYTADKQDVIVDEIETDVEELQILKEELTKKEKDLEKVFKDYEDQSISMNKLKAFKEELEASESAIEYFVVDEGTPYIGLTLSEIEFPEDLLLGLIIRDGQAIIPAGDTEIKTGDKIMLLGKKEAVVEMLYKFIPKAEELQ
ncbi:hypothetical protein H8E88_04260 [candidate division KSB1 bacterium]|nr:hypothetical protein [candidate division KSB1 bacterium]